MVNRPMTLKELQRAVAREKRKAKTAGERATLQRELKQLREGKNVKLLRRFGRGFVALTKEGAKATGRGIVKARKFAREERAGEGLDVELVSSIPQKSSQVRPDRIKSTRVKPTRIIRTKRKSPKQILVTRKVKTTTRRIRSRPRKKRKMARRSVQDNGSFFNGLSDLGI